MRFHRFYIKGEINKDKNVQVDDRDLINQWRRVFRFLSGDRIILFNDTGFEFVGSFIKIEKDMASILVEETCDKRNQINIKLHIFQSIIKKDNFEMVVQKCTEIGAYAFHPVISERSEKKSLNVERLIKIAKEASEQSGKVFVPEIFPIQDLYESLRSFSGKVAVLDFISNEKTLLENIVSSDIAIFIGPEGGWSENEREYFKKNSIQTISLGDQVLRSETASIAISSLILLK